MRVPLIILFLVLVQIKFISAQETINCNDQTTVNITNLPDSCLSTDTAITLKGLPLGGNFYGTGVINKKFNPLRLNTSNYTVTYVYVDSNGCSYTDCRNIKVTRKTGTLYVPNAFSPNGDSINDVFKISCSIYSNFHITIFSRWGEQIFSSNSINDYWKGMKNNTGTVLQEAIYYWLIEITEYNGDISKYNGTVMLLNK